MNKIIVIIPAFNESKKIELVINKVKKYCLNYVSEICVIDDCSSDDTYQKALKSGIKVFKHKKNLGVGAAIRTGLDYAYKAKFDIAVIISGDDQHNPEEIKKVIDPIINGQANFVQGSRFIQNGRNINQPFFRKFLTKSYPIFFMLFTGKKCSDVTNGLRAFQLSKIFNNKEINLHQEWLNRYELEVYLLYKAYVSKTIIKQEVPITINYHKNRKERTKMIPFVDWWRIFRPLIYLKLKIKK